MSGALFLSALLFAAVGITSAHAPWKTAILTAAGVIAAALLTSFLPPDALSAKLIMIGAGLSIVPAILLVYFPRLLSPTPLFLIAIHCGAWAGALLSMSGQQQAMLVAAPLLAVSLPARWLIQRRWQIGLKVAASWMLAIALLAVTLNTISMPSYQLDHME